METTTAPAVSSAWPDEEPPVSTATGTHPVGTWLWPFPGPHRLLAAYRAPAHAYGPGHRGIDVAGGGVVRSPSDGVVAYRGIVVDRPLLTIDHGNGSVTTYEPVVSTLTPGTPVARGDPVGTAATGGHTPPGSVHVGVRVDGVYVDPLPLFERAPRAILLRCGGEVC